MTSGGGSACSWSNSRFLMFQENNRRTQQGLRTPERMGTVVGVCPVKQTTNQRPSRPRDSARLLKTAVTSCSSCNLQRSSHTLNVDHSTVLDDHTRRQHTLRRCGASSPTPSSLDHNTRKNIRTLSSSSNRTAQPLHSPNQQHRPTRNHPHLHPKAPNSAF